MSVKEVGTELVISGTYAEMSPIISKLKSRGFRYNGADKTWRIPIADLTPAKRKNLDVLLHGKVLTPEQETEKKKEQETQLKVVGEALKDLASRKFPGLAVTFTGRAFRVQGTTYPIKDSLKALGGRWEVNAFEFDLYRVTLEQISKLAKLLDERGNFNEDRAKVVQALLGSDRKINWPNLGISLMHTDHEGYSIKGATKPFADKIRHIFEHPNWTGSYWALRAMTEGPEPFKKLIAFFDAAEKEKASAPPPEPKAAPEPKCRPNMKGDHCSICGEYLAAGDGCLYAFMDEEDDDRTVWKVHHKDTSVCKANQKRQEDERKILREKHLQKSVALKNIRDWVKMHENTPSPRPGDGRNGHIQLHKLQGKQTYVSGRDSVIYGGGEWVIVEPDEKHFWLVRNNGSDGDDWSISNVQTGGAGAIGERAPLTPEVLAWIEAAS